MFEFRWFIKPDINFLVLGDNYCYVYIEVCWSYK